MSSSDRHVENMLVQNALIRLGNLATSVGTLLCLPQPSASARIDAAIPQLFSLLQELGNVREQIDLLRADRKASQPLPPPKVKLQPHRRPYYSVYRRAKRDRERNQRKDRHDGSEYT